MDIIETYSLVDGFAETINSFKQIGTEAELLYLMNERRCKDIKTYVAMLNGKAIGTASFFVFPHLYGFVGHVEDVVVHPDHRKAGVGRALMERIEQDARKSRCYKIILDCSDDNIPFYERNGYRRKDNQMRKDL